MDEIIQIEWTPEHEYKFHAFQQYMSSLEPEEIADMALSLYRTNIILNESCGHLQQAVGGYEDITAPTVEDETIVLPMFQPVGWQGWLLLPVFMFLSIVGYVCLFLSWLLTHEATTDKPSGERTERPTSDRQGEAVS